MLCLGAAAALTVLTRDSVPPAAPAELSFVVQRMPFEAQNALRGESSAFDALAKSAARLKSLRAAVPDRSTGSGGAAAWNKLTEAVATVGAARNAVETIEYRIRRRVNWRPSCCPNSAILPARSVRKSSRA